jgi:uncharacterized membrane protein
MPTYSKDRVEIFSDAVFAIALTLLVLELHPPEVANHAGLAEYATAMTPLIPKFATFILTFVAISIQWVGHHYFFRHITGTPIGLVWINNLFLLWICFLPFPTAMLGDHPTSQFPVLFYAIVSFLMALNFFAFRIYTVRANLFEKPTEYMKIMGPKHSLPAIIVYALAILLAFVNVYLSWICFIIVPLLYFVPNLIQALKQTARAATIQSNRT